MAELSTVLGQVVEPLVLDPRFAQWFTDDEEATARGRLDDFGYAASA